MCLLNSLLLGGKCLLIRFKKSQVMLVLALLLYGGLYHITLRCWRLRSVRVCLLLSGGS